MSNKQWSVVLAWLVVIMASLLAPIELARWIVGGIKRDTMDLFMQFLIAGYIATVMLWVAWLARPNCMRASAKGSPSGN